MRPFRAGEAAYERSIAIDASTIGDITITVAVSAERTDELAILDSIYAAAEGYPFFPFRDKSHDLTYEDSVEFFETVVRKNSQYLKATAHLGQDGSDSERVEAVQSAVLAEQLGVEDSLVILDGNEDKADRFGRAITGISGSCPPMATCIQSELYYPTSLLADLCASHLAYQIDHPRHCSEVTPTAPVTKEEFNNLWGPAYNEIVNSSTPVSTEPIEQRRAETVPTRMNCWFKGLMGGGEPVQFESSVRPIVQYARREGYEELATRLSEV
ncbi:hypothetical protein AMS69_19455 [Haloarcula rubripromontorii]|uniref:Uncharacterized protein n=1 Tax=Haloarcula rubripromontorii TaxID=1705562 RepID=A0A0N0U8L2_9EURY|nr:hypothetical protein AMS69_19455 [Haloarcula rubripromontorii]